MTVPSTARRAGPYTGNGSTTTFSFSFKTFAAGDLQVTRMDTFGVEATLVLNSDYSVSLNVDQDASPGGTITYPITGSPLPTGHKLTIVGDLEYEQTTDLLGGGAFNARVIEDTFDRAVIQIQQLEERQDRSLQIPVNSTANTQLPNPEANAILAWNTAGTALANKSPSDIATVAAFINWSNQVFNGTGSQTAFTLQNEPGAVGNLDVSISGVTQVNGVDFSVNGKVLTFTSAPPLGVNNVFVRYGQALPVLSVGSGRTNVKDYGAAGDGVADDTGAFQAAVDAVQAAGGGTIFVPAGRYRIKRQVLITGNNVSIKGDGAGSVIDMSQMEYFTQFGSLDIDFQSATYYRKGAFALRGTFVKEAYLDTAAMPVLQNEATLQLVAGGASGIQVGDSVYLRSKQHWYGVGERFNVSKIIDISGDVVTLMDGVQMQFDASGTVRKFVVDTNPPYTEWGGYYTWPTEATLTRIIVWRPVKNFAVSDLTVEGGGMSFTAVGHGPTLDGVTPQTITAASTIINGAGQCFLHAQYAEGVRVQNVDVSKVRGVAVIGMYSNDFSVTNCTFKGLEDDSFLITENVNSGWYPIYLSQGRNYAVNGCTFNRTRHGPDGSECFNFVQVGNTAHRTFRAAFGSHQEVYNLTIANNTAHNCYSFAVLRAKDAVVTGNSVYASNSDAQPNWGAAIITTGRQTLDLDDPGYILVSGNSFIVNATLPGGAITIGAATRQCNISNNTISVRCGGAIRMEGAKCVNTVMANNNITFTALQQADYPGHTPYINPTLGIVFDPETVPANWAAFLGSQTLSADVKDISITGNVIEGYGGGTSTPNSGHGIVFQGPPESSLAIENVLVSNNVGKPLANDASFFLRFNPGGYYGRNITVCNNTVLGDNSALVGFSASDEHLFYEAPFVYGNTGPDDAKKSHQVAGAYELLGDCTTVIRGTLWNRTQPGKGAGSQYIVTESGTTGTLAGGITATTTLGSPIVSLSGNNAGDTFVVPGSYISIAGANTGVRVLSVSANYASCTIEANASATVTSAAVTRFNPVFDVVSSVGGAPPLVVVNATPVTLVPGNHYAFANTGLAITGTLPANPSPGDTVWVVSANNRVDNVIDRNGNLLLNASANYTLTSATESIALRFVSAARGWQRL